MTGRSKIFEIAIYVLVAVAVLALATWAQSPGLGVIAALVMLGFALRVAWTDRTKS